jgi:hypothetical protein
MKKDQDFSVEFDKRLLNEQGPGLMYAMVLMIFGAIIGVGFWEFAQYVFRALIENLG